MDRPAEPDGAADLAHHDDDDDDEPTVAHPGPGPLDLSGALHTAGHEVELLHAEGVTDSAPALHDERDGGDHFDLTAAGSFGLRGMDGDLASIDDEEHPNPD